MKKTTIYIFGPRRLASAYFSDKPMTLDQGGWLKIGITNKQIKDADSKRVAYWRVNEEVRTGIPEVCQIYDAFEYPLQTSKVDDVIRKILTDRIYNLENSKTHNSSVNSEKYEIKAGNEFVYGVKRSQVLNAIANFEHSLILQYYGSDNFDSLMQCIKSNAQNIELDLSTEEESNNSENSVWFDALWNDIKKEISKHIDTGISIPPNKPYFLIHSKVLKGTMKYFVSYSVRSKLVFVGVETYAGESGRYAIEQSIESSAKDHPIKHIEATQGIKNKNKWAWSISDTTDKSKEDLHKWYVDTILSLYNFFEE